MNCLSKHLPLVLFSLCVWGAFGAGMTLVSSSAQASEAITGASISGIPSSANCSVGYPLCTSCDTASVEVCLQYEHDNGSTVSYDTDITLIEDDVYMCDVAFGDDEVEPGMYTATYSYPDGTSIMCHTFSNAWIGYETCMDAGSAAEFCARFEVHSAWGNEVGWYGYETVMPVEVEEFAAVTSPEGTWLEWTTSWESGNAGWRVIRSFDESGGYEAINDGLIPPYQYYYEYFDDTAPRDVRLYYRLQDVATEGLGRIHEPIWIVLTDADIDLDGRVDGLDLVVASIDLLDEGSEVDEVISMMGVVTKKGFLQ